MASWGAWLGAWSRSLYRLFILSSIYRREAKVRRLERFLVLSKRWCILTREAAVFFWSSSSSYVVDSVHNIVHGGVDCYSNIREFASQRGSSIPSTLPKILAIVQSSRPCIVSSTLPHGIKQHVSVDKEFSSSILFLLRAALPDKFDEDSTLPNSKIDRVSISSAMDMT